METKILGGKNIAVKERKYWRHGEMEKKILGEMERKILRKRISSIGEKETFL